MPTTTTTPNGTAAPVRSPYFDAVKSEVETAYADCHGRKGDDWQHGMNRRNLNFRASHEVTRDEAREIMTAYVPGYNEFKPELIGKLPADSRVTIAREGSVCLYVRTLAREEISADELRADEVDAESSPHYDAPFIQIRIWWD
jgi:hypothetical protein